jgi:hypothetical protein
MLSNSNCELRKFEDFLRELNTYEKSQQIKGEIDAITNNETLQAYYNSKDRIITLLMQYIGELKQMLKSCDRSQSNKIQDLQKKYTDILNVILEWYQTKSRSLNLNSNSNTSSNSNSNSYSNISANSNSYSNPNPFNSYSNSNSNSNPNPFNSNPNSYSNSNSYSNISANSNSYSNPNPFNSYSNSNSNSNLKANSNSNSILSASASANSSSSNLYKMLGLSPNFTSCQPVVPIQTARLSSTSSSSPSLSLSSMSSSTSSQYIPGDWHGPIDSPTQHNTTSYELTECQKLIQDIVAEIRAQLVDWENFDEGFDITTILEVMQDENENENDFKTRFDKLSADDKKICGIFGDFNKFIKFQIFRSFLIHPNRSFFGEETSIPGFKVINSQLKKWEEGRKLVYDGFYNQLFPSQNTEKNTSTKPMENGVDEVEDVVDEDEHTQAPKPENSSASLQMISSVTQSACNLLPQVYSAIFNKLTKMPNIDINAKITELSVTEDFNQAGRDMTKTQQFIRDKSLLIENLTKSVGTVDIIHDVDNIANTQLASITEFSKNNKGIIGKGGQCNPKLLHKLIDDLFIDLINNMIASGITDVKAPEYITLNEEDVMIYILACILEKVEITMSESDLLKKELFWYESGIKWEGMTSFCDFFDKQDKIKQAEILHKACSISRKQIADPALYSFIKRCKENGISFMFKQLSLCNFDAGPSTGSVGISAGLINQVGIDRDDVCLICNKTDDGKFYWICCVYNRADNSTLSGLKDRQPKAIFFGDNSASIDSLKIALNYGIVPGKTKIFGSDTHFRCANANNVTIPFWTGSYSVFLRASSLSDEVEQFIHETAIAKLNGVNANAYVSSNAYGPCQLFLSTSSSDVNINCVLVIKTSGDCIQECVQKEYYLREPNDMGQGYNAGIFVAGKNIAVDFTVDSFVGKRKFERYSTGGGNLDGTCPGIFQQQSGHGAKYSLPIGLFQNPQDKATAFVVKIFGFQSLLNTLDKPGSPDFNRLCDQLFHTNDIELGRINTVVDFIQDVNHLWLNAIDQAEIGSDIFSEFFYKLLCFQQEINIGLINKTVTDLNAWDNNDMNILLSMPTVDHIIRDDVSNDYENNSGNLISEIFGEWELLYKSEPAPLLRLWITGLTSNGLECRFLFNNNNYKKLLEAAQNLSNILTTDDQKEIGIERIVSSTDIYFTTKKLEEHIIHSLNSNQINAEFKIKRERDDNERSRDFNWCLTAAYKIPAGLESLISVLSQQKTLGMSKITLDELKIRINDLCSSSVNTLTMRASRLRVNGVASPIEVGLDRMLTNLITCLHISEEGADILEDDYCIYDSNSNSSSNSSSISRSSSGDSAYSTRIMDGNDSSNRNNIDINSVLGFQEALLNSFETNKKIKTSNENGNSGKEIGGSKTRKCIKKYRNTRRKTKHYTKKHYTRRHYTKRHYTKKHYTKKHYTKK